MRIQYDPKLNLVLLLRRAGYGLINNHQGQTSFIKSLGRFKYPRFHVYIREGFINLHLDQRPAVRQGNPAHNAEYDGEVVEEEGKRIKAIMDVFDKNQ